MSQSSESSDSIISNSSDSDYIPSQTPETEDYTSQQSRAKPDESSDSIISNSSDSDYIPSQTPETEDYTSQQSRAKPDESSEPLTPAESEYSTDDYSSLDKV